jgi:hypothetical protein
MGTISIRKVSLIATPLAGRVNLAVKTDDLLYIKDENGIEYPIGAGELGGTHYLFVKGDGTDTENAQELQAAYDEAKLLLPFSPITQADAITILVAPGLYNFGSTTFELDTEYINVVALNSTNPIRLYGPVGNARVTFNSTDPNGTIFINSDNVYVYGVDVDSKNFRVGDNLSSIKIESCSGGDFSFGGVLFGDPPLDISGTFINCQGGDLSFAGNGEANGRFIGCQGGQESFGYDFASGEFIDCIGGDFSFAYGGIMTGTFENCKGGVGSFGSIGGIGGSVTRNCQADDGSFGFNAIIFDSTFEYCTGGEDSFGKTFLTTNEGKFYNCRLSVGTFDTPTVGGFIVLGIDGNNTVQNITGF